MFKILALDQATKKTGYALITKKGVQKYGIVEADDTLSYIERLRIMDANINSLIDKFKPSFVVFEATQYQNNLGAYNTLSMLQGIIMCELFRRDIGFLIIPATCWKSFCGIKGKRRAEQKTNTIQFVLDRYGWSVAEDEADAIGIATWAIGNIEEDKNGSNC